jgi:hypothetical protein
MNPFTVDFELAVQHFGQHRKAGVVISGNIDEACARPALGQKSPGNVRVLSAPEESLSEAQGINDVAHEHHPLGLDALQEFSQLAYPSALVAEVDVREE